MYGRLRTPQHYLQGIIFSHWKHGGAQCQTKGHAAARTQPVHDVMLDCPGESERLLPAKGGGGAVHFALPIWDPNRK